MKPREVRIGYQQGERSDTHGTVGDTESAAAVLTLLGERGKSPEGCVATLLLAFAMAANAFIREEDHEALLADLAPQLREIIASVQLVNAEGPVQ